MLKYSNKKQKILKERSEKARKANLQNIELIFLFTGQIYTSFY